MRPLPFLSASFILALAFGAALADAAPPALKVSAGDHSRTRVPVAVHWPHGPGPWELRGPGGESIPLQVSGEAAWFILPSLERGATAVFEVRPAAKDAEAAEAPARMKAVREDGALVLRHGDRPALRYLAGPGELPRDDIPAHFRRGGYIHPVWTPSGRVVTDDYPPNHVHHHGIWTAWTQTRFEGRAPDFWNMGERKARVDFEQLGRVEDGPVFASFSARHSFTDLLASPARIALTETWEVRAFALDGATGGFAFDLAIEQRAAGKEPLLLPKYYYGGLGIRGPWNWNGAGNARHLDSNGQTDRIAANETRARWHWIGGQVDGQLAGIAVLGHPDNFRAPQPLRVHPREPFVCWAPSQLGDWAIRPNEPFASRYRVIPMDGEPSPEELDRLWNDFAFPPEVTPVP